jgi:hypothetical protein
MIEVNRRLYMDEETGEKLLGFEKVRQQVIAVKNSVINAWRDMPSL